MAEYSFRAKLWIYKGVGWHFLTLPKKLSKTVRDTHGKSEEGWGRLKTTARIGTVTWPTAIWFSVKHGSYLLPIKADIRKKAKLMEGSAATTILRFKDGELKTKTKRNQPRLFGED